MHEPALCRYCHSEMTPQAYIDGAYFSESTVKYTYGAYCKCLTCGATSPRVEHCKGNCKDALEEAYRLATIEDMEELYK